MLPPSKPAKLARSLAAFNDPGWPFELKHDGTDLASATGAIIAKAREVNAVRKQLGTWMAVGTSLVIGLAASAQQGRRAVQGDETAQSLINMERRWAEADCDGNLAIQTILADDFQGTAPDGTRYTKAQEIQDTKTSKHEDHECRLGDTTVHFFGDNIAVIYGTESRIGKEGDGTEHTRTLIWTDTWLKREGHWQIVAAQDNWATPKQ